MELEDLNKTQTILLVLFVSFVTSIATGIVTVTLLDQAPPAVTHTISKVVETTVERVVPPESQEAATVKTVVVKEENLIAEAAKKNTAYSVGIFTATPPSEEDAETEKGDFVSSGILVRSNGTVITDSKFIVDDTPYVAELSSGRIVDASVEGQNEKEGIAVLSLALDEDTQSSATFRDVNSLSLGQNIVTIFGTKEKTLAFGVVTHLEKGEREIIVDDEDSPEGSATTTESYISTIHTNLDVPVRASGGMLLNTDGNVVGMNLVRETGVIAVPSNTIQGYLRSLADTKKEAKKEEQADS